MLDLIVKRTPELLDKDLLERVRRIDCLGGPKVDYFGSVGPFSATTLFYLKIAGDIKRIFGDVKNLMVIEIGGGCGSLCKVLHEVLDIEQYVIIDVPECIELARKHLAALDLHHVRFLTPDEVNFEACDLLISCYGFSQSSAPLQKRYLKKLFPAAARGYFMCGFYPKQYQTFSMDKNNLLKRIQKVKKEIQIYPEEPTSGNQNFLLTWSL